VYSFTRKTEIVIMQPIVAIIFKTFSVVLTSTTVIRLNNYIQPIWKKNTPTVKLLKANKRAGISLLLCYRFSLQMAAMAPQNIIVIPRILNKITNLTLGQPEECSNWTITLQGSSGLEIT
jgi:hypothetical protein